MLPVGKSSAGGAARERRAIGGSANSCCAILERRRVAHFWLKFTERYGNVPKSAVSANLTCL